MKLVLFNTNLAAKAVLSLLADQEECVIFTDQENILHLLEAFNFTYVHTYFVKSSFIWSNYGEIIKTKKLVRTLLLQHGISTIHIFHLEFGGLYNWIIKYAIKQNIPVSYIKVLKDLKLDKAYSLAGLKHSLVNYLYYGIWPTIYKSGSCNVYPKIPQSITKSIKTVEILNNSVFIKECVNKLLKSFDINNKQSVVLLTGSVVSSNELDLQDYRQVIENVINHFGKENIVCKCHPRFDDEIEIERDLPHLPSFIPMELLFDWFETYVSVSSAVLINATLEDKESISLIDMCQSASEEYKESIKYYFKGLNIKYPKQL